MPPGVDELNDPSQLGRMMKAARIATPKRTTIKHVAFKLGVNRKTIEDWEKGIRKAPTDKIIRYSHALLEQGYPAEKLIDILKLYDPPIMNQLFDIIIGISKISQFIRPSELGFSEKIWSAHSRREITEGHPLFVKRITDPEDEDLFIIWKLQTDEFSDVTTNSYKDMKLWISEIDKGLAQTGIKCVDDIMLSLKYNDEVVGYLYAAYYINLKVIFISYLEINKNIQSAKRNGVHMMLEKLIEICSEPPRSWDTIVAEVEQAKRNRKNHSYDLFVNFKRYSKIQSKIYGGHGQLFMLDFDYLQPAVDPESMGIKVVDSPSLNQKIILFLKKLNKVTRNLDLDYFLPGSEVIELFHQIIIRWYGDGYPDSKKYQEYLKEFELRYREKLSGGIRLIEE